MLGEASNPMLAQAEQGIQSKVKPEMQANLQKVIQAGLTIMYSPQLTDKRNQMIANSKDPAQDAAQGSARLVSNLYQQSGKKMPTDLIVPAAMIFAFEWLDLVAKAGKIQITPDVIANVTQDVGKAVLPMFGVTPDKLAALQGMAQKQGAGAPSPQPGDQPAPAAPAPAGGIISNAMGA